MIEKENPSGEQETMRILYPVSEGFDPTRARFLQIFQTSHALAKLGCEVDLIMGRNQYNLLTDALPYYDLNPHENLRLHTVRMLRSEGNRKIRVSWNGIFHFTCWLRINKLLRNNTYHVLYTRHLNVADFFLKYRKTLRLPILFEAHEIFFLTTERKEKTKAIRSQEMRVYSQIDGLVAITEELRRQLENLFPISSPTTVIPSGVNLQLFQDNKERMKSKKILYIGQLYPWKGVDTLIEAMKYVVEGELHIVGGGEEEITALIDKAKQLDIANRIFFHGQVPHQKVKDFLRETAVAVHPLAEKDSNFAEFSSPLKIFEYMAARVPIVASDLPGTREILTDGVNAVLVPPNESLALAMGIQKILTDPSFGDSLAENAYKAVLLYSWDERAQRIRRFIRIIRGKGLNEK